MLQWPVPYKWDLKSPLYCKWRPQLLSVICCQWWCCGHECPERRVHHWQGRLREGVQPLCCLAGILLDASIDLVPVVSMNYRKLLAADFHRSQGACFAKGWPSQAQAGNCACPCSPVIRQLRCHTITVLIASVGLGHWWKSLPSLYLLGVPPVPSLLLLAVGRLGPRGLCIPPLQHSPCWCCPVAAVKWHLNKKLSSLISSLVLCHWAGDRVPISFTRTPGHKTLGLFLTSNQGALIKETVTSFMSLLA